MSTIEEIEEAIVSLPIEQRDKVRKWINELDDDWDRQIAEDVAAGRLDHLGSEVDEDFEAALPLGLDARDERVSGAQPARALLGILRACAGQKSERVDVLIEVGPMDAQSRTDELPVRSLLVRTVRDPGVDLDQYAYRLAVFGVDA